MVKLEKSDKDDGIKGTSEDTLWNIFKGLEGPGITDEVCAFFFAKIALFRIRLRKSNPAKHNVFFSHIIFGKHYAKDLNKYFDA